MGEGNSFSLFTFRGGGGGVPDPALDGGGVPDPALDAGGSYVSDFRGGGEVSDLGPPRSQIWWGGTWSQ